MFIISVIQPHLLLYELYETHPLSRSCISRSPISPSQVDIVPCANVCPFFTIYYMSSISPSQVDVVYESNLGALNL